MIRIIILLILIPIATDRYILMEIITEIHSCKKCREFMTVECHTPVNISTKQLLPLRLRKNHVKFFRKLIFT